QVYQVSGCFPVEERFGLSGQMRRAAVSVPSNIAEGVARASTQDYLRFLVIARGSLAELDTQLELAAMLNYLTPEHPIFTQLRMTGKLLSGLIKSLKAKIEKG
ncbi:MAG: four helix bundle protein, partial [Halioglobus sp.]